MVIRAKQERLFPKFLYQFLTSPEITKWLQHLAESRSGTFPQITFDQVASLHLPLPSLAEQRAIASVLGALDDKIELNRRMNETLEALAQSLFKSWFVDFDPVRTQGGRFEKSAFGKIPAGWTHEQIRNQVEAVFDGPHATPPEAESGAVYLGIKNFTGTQLNLSDL